MRRCSSCGTRLSPEAFRCWLCHAAAPDPTERVEQEVLPAVVPKDHVWGGTLARTSQHADPDPIAAGLFGSRRPRGTTFGQRLSALIAPRIRKQHVT
jgi:hypothetical protein